MVSVKGYVVHVGDQVHRTYDVDPSDGRMTATGVHVMADAARLACDHPDQRVTVEIVAGEGGS